MSPGFGRSPMHLTGSVTDAITGAARFLHRGPAHRRRLELADVRIAVVGTRDRTLVTHTLSDVFDTRGYDTYTNVADRDTVLFGDDGPAAGGEQVTLTETVRELRGHPATEVLILENRATDQYVSRLFNESVADPHLVVLTGVSEAHDDASDQNALERARTFCRAVPKDSHVVSGEQDERLKAYVERELQRKEVTVSHAAAPTQHGSTPYTRITALVDTVLTACDQSPLSARRRARLLGRYQPNRQWVQLPTGRVCDATAADVLESVEHARRAFVATDGLVEPFVHLPEGDRDTIRSVLEQFEAIATTNAFERIHVAGTYARAFGKSTSFPVVAYDTDRVTPSALVDELVSYGNPIVLAGTADSPYVCALEAEIKHRSRQPENDVLAAETNVALDSSPTVRRVTTEHKPLPTADAGSGRTRLWSHEETGSDDEGEEEETDPTREQTRVWS